MTIRPSQAGDAAAFARIYAPHVIGSAVSFEVEAPDADEMAGRIVAGGDLYPWLTATDADGDVIGYAYATAFRARAAYRFTVETSVYVDENAQRKGTGALLYDSLLPILEAQGFTQAVAAITVPNPVSALFHERYGFVHAGTYRQVGYKHGAWRDVGLWQRPLAPPADPPAEPLPWRTVATAYRR